MFRGLLIFSKLLCKLDYSRRNVHCFVLKWNIQIDTEEHFSGFFLAIRGTVINIKENNFNSKITRFWLYDFWAVVWHVSF